MTRTTMRAWVRAWATGALLTSCQSPSEPDVFADPSVADSGDPFGSPESSTSTAAADGGESTDATRTDAPQDGGDPSRDPTPPQRPPMAPPPGSAFSPTAFISPHGMPLAVDGPGQGWADIDGDGWLDLLAIGGSQPSHLWHNDAGQLVPSALDADLSPYLNTAGVTLPDFDNDGDPDVLLLGASGPHLLRNDDGLALVDVTAASGVTFPGFAESATWGDYDSDGHLDLFLSTLGTADDVLLHATGEGHFEPQTHLLPGDVAGQSFAASWSDFDDDGDLDLYVVVDKFDGNRMWRNDGPGCGGWCFSNVSVGWGVDAQGFLMGLGIGDIDNDLDLDLSLSDVGTHHVFRQDRPRNSPAFVAVSAAYGVQFDAHGWGTVMFDYDNDGWLDLYVADARGPEAGSRLFRNLGGDGFADVSAECGCTEPGFAFGVSHADFDADGAIDVMVGYSTVGHRLYRNRAVTGHHWLEVDLEGGGPVNRDAVGSRVIVHTSDGRSQRRDVEIGTSIASQHSLRLHFGLGDAHATAIEIRWPDGRTQSLPGPATDAVSNYAYPE